MKLAYTIIYVDDVEAAMNFYKKAFDKAIEAGAELVSLPTKKEWGQTVSYVRDLNGLLIKICSEM